MAEQSAGTPSVDPPAGHQPVISHRTGEVPERLDPALVERFRTAFVPDVSDAVGALYTMDSAIRPLYAGMPRLLGTAVTVKAPRGDNWAIHAGLSRCGQGDVLVVDWRGYTEACGTGALTTLLAMRRGLAGVVVDGAWRDISDLRRLGFPIMGRGISPFSPGGRKLGEINVPVCCGGVIVEPGDLVLGDDDGVAVVPHREARKVAGSLPPYQELRSISDPVEAGPASDISQSAAAYWAKAAQQ